MGYTHYINNFPGFTDTQWNAFVADVKLLFASSKVPLAGPHGVDGTMPVLTPYVSFNGVGEDAHETAHIGKTPTNFEFCKTAHKPYDEIVVQFYKLIRKHAPGTELSSDGGPNVFRYGPKPFKKFFSGKPVSSPDEEFNKWWEKNGIVTTPAAIGLSYREIALRSWNAGRAELARKF